MELRWNVPGGLSSWRQLLRTHSKQLPQPPWQENKAALLIPFWLQLIPARNTCLQHPIFLGGGEEISKTKDISLLPLELVTLERGARASKGLSTTFSGPLCPSQSLHCKDEAVKGKHSARAPKPSPFLLFQGWIPRPETERSGLVRGSFTLPTNPI